MKQNETKTEITKINLFGGLSNNEEITEEDVLTLQVLMKKGRISNSKLTAELNLKGANLTTSKSAGRCKKKLEKMGVIENYPAKINWDKIGYKTEFVVIGTTDNENMAREIERKHIAAIKEYREQTGLDIFIIPVSKKGDKIILREVILYDGEKPITIISGIATDDWAATAFANFYLPKRYPEMSTTLLIVKRSSIRDFEFRDESIELLSSLLFSDVEIEKYRDIFKKEFGREILKTCEK